MSIWARIKGRDFRITGGDWKSRLDDADEFSFRVLARDVPDYQALLYQDAALIYNGALLVSGEIVASRFYRANREQPLQIEFDCTGELGRLEGVKAAAGAHYQNTAVTSILNTILPADWTLRLVNMVDPLLETTIDVRNKETLLPQIVAVIGGLPNLHFRYGGLDSNGEYVLEIGDFNTLTEHYVVGVNAQHIQRDYTSHGALSEILPYGYLSSDTIVTLTDLYSDPPTQTLHPAIAARITAHPDYANFAVVPDGVEFVVQNPAVSISRSTRRQYRLVKTKNDFPPTADERAEAAYALWLSTVADLKQSSLYEKFSAQVLLYKPPSIGDKAQLIGIVREPVIDPLSQVMEYIETFRLDAQHRIVSFNTKFELGEMEGQDGIWFEVDLTSNNEAEVIDPELEIYRRLEPVDNFDSPQASVILSPPLLASQTHDNGDASDCSGPGSIAAKTFTVTSPTPPVGSISVVTSVAVVPSTAVIYSETPPANPGDDWVGCVSAPAGAAWPPAAGQDVTVIVSFLFF